MYALFPPASTSSTAFINGLAAGFSRGRPDARTATAGRLLARRRPAGRGLLAPQRPAGRSLLTCLAPCPGDALGPARFCLADLGAAPDAFLTDGRCGRRSENAIDRGRDVRDRRHAVDGPQRTALAVI